MAVRTPRKLLQQFGVQLPAGTRVVVHDSTAEMRYLVLPMRPEVRAFSRCCGCSCFCCILHRCCEQGSEGWSEQQLRTLVTRDCMIGTRLPLTPT
jgi:nitrile hydratase